jgi:phosphoenolpyruvate-protein phosphotransferase (PTS system enzyme I)
LRTEFLYLDRSSLPDEEEQYRAYSEIIRIMGKLPVIIRTLDIGGDKPLPFLNLPKEQNPFLGVRAIRLCLKRPDMFRTQLRAILRSSVSGNVRIMFPMVATLDEVRQVRQALALAKESLSMDGLEYAPDIGIGIMVETPAAAVMSDVLAREVDFFSIGSNDLTQYTLCCDRGNADLAYLYNTWDPSILRLIRTVIESAHSQGKTAGLCGEFASRSDAIPFLLGLGLDEFSMNPEAIPLAKQVIRTLSLSQCRQITAGMLEKATGAGLP